MRIEEAVRRGPWTLMASPAANSPPSGGPRPCAPKILHISGIYLCTASRQPRSLAAGARWRGRGGTIELGTRQPLLGAYPGTPYPDLAYFARCRILDMVVSIPSRSFSRYLSTSMSFCTAVSHHLPRHAPLFVCSFPCCCMLLQATRTTPSYHPATSPRWRQAALPQPITGHLCTPPLEPSLPAPRHPL